MAPPRHPATHRASRPTPPSPPRRSPLSTCGRRMPSSCPPSRHSRPCLRPGTPRPCPRVHAGEVSSNTDSRRKCAQGHLRRRFLRNTSAEPPGMRSEHQIKTRAAVVGRLRGAHLKKRSENRCQTQRPRRPRQIPVCEAQRSEPDDIQTRQRRQAVRGLPRDGVHQAHHHGERRNEGDGRRRQREHAERHTDRRMIARTRLHRGRHRMARIARPDGANL